MRVCACEDSHPRSPEVGAGSPEAGVQGSFELPSVGVGNCTWVLHKNSEQSQLLSHLTRPVEVWFAFKY